MRPQAKRLIAIGVLLNVAALVALFWLVLDMRSTRTPPSSSTSFRDSSGTSLQERAIRRKLDAFIADATWEAGYRMFERESR